MSKRPITLIMMLVMVLGAGISMAGKAPEGEALVRERCTRCHTLERVDRARKDRAGWETTVDRMVSKRPGLLDAEERAAVLNHLANR